MKRWAWGLVTAGLALASARSDCDGDRGESGWHAMLTVVVSFWEVGCWRGQVVCDGQPVTLLDGSADAAVCQARGAAAWPVVERRQLSFSWLDRYAACALCDLPQAGAACTAIGPGEPEIPRVVGSPPGPGPADAGGGDAADVVDTADVTVPADVPPDARADVAPDAPDPADASAPDTGRDVAPADTQADAPAIADTSRDAAHADAPADALADAPVPADVPATPDIGRDAVPADAPADAPSDLVPDALADIPADALPEFVPDASTPDASTPDATPDAAPDVTPADAGPDTPPVFPLRLVVLFVGNSYTFVNDLPALVAALAAASGVAPTIAVESVTVGGARLRDHLETTGALARIRAGGLDVVVLQGQSTEPLTSPADFQAAAATLAAEIWAAGATPAFYETWARAEGHAAYSEPWSGGSPAAMQAGLRAAYLQAATAAAGVYVPAGDAWEATLAAHPDIPLFAADGSHPDLPGSYLVACVFYLELTGRADFGPAPYEPPGLPAADAAALRAVARATLGR